MRSPTTARWKPYPVTTVADGVDRSGDGILTINDRRVDGPTGVIDLAHDRGLLVHAYTFRNDVSGYGFSDPKEELAFYFRAGLDGLFTDFTDTGVAARQAAAVPSSGVLSLLGIAALGALRLRKRAARQAR